MEQKNNQAAQSRKKFYYAGIALIGFGSLLVLSVLFSFIAIIMSFEKAVNPFTAIVRALISMMTIGAGQFMMKVGRGEMNGSEEPHQADHRQEEISPSHEGEQVTAGETHPELTPVPDNTLKVRCLQCQQWNEKDAGICSGCGLLF